MSYALVHAQVELKARIDLELAYKSLQQEHQAMRSAVDPVLVRHQELVKLIEPVLQRLRDLESCFGPLLGHAELAPSILHKPLGIPNDEVQRVQPWCMAQPRSSNATRLATSDPPSSSKRRNMRNTPTAAKHGRLSQLVGLNGTWNGTWSGEQLGGSNEDLTSVGQRRDVKGSQTMREFRQQRQSTAPGKLWKIPVDDSQLKTRYTMTLRHNVHTRTDEEQPLQSGNSTHARPPSDLRPQELSGYSRPRDDSGVDAAKCIKTPILEAGAVLNSVVKILDPESKLTSEPNRPLHMQTMPQKYTDALVSYERALMHQIDQLDAQLIFKPARISDAPQAEKALSSTTSFASTTAGSPWPPGLKKNGDCR